MTETSFSIHLSCDDSILHTDGRKEVL